MTKLMRTDGKFGSLSKVQASISPVRLFPDAADTVGRDDWAIVTAFIYDFTSTEALAHIGPWRRVVNGPVRHLYLVRVFHIIIIEITLSIVQRSTRSTQQHPLHAAPFPLNLSHVDVLVIEISFCKCM